MSQDRPNKKDNYKRPENWSTQDFYDKLMNVEGVTGGRHFQKQAEQEYRVHITPDKSVSPAKFVPDPIAPGQYRAHPRTIRAMRKELFVAGAEMFEDLEVPYQCFSCSKQLDLQFWQLCPYCEAEIKAST